MRINLPELCLVALVGVTGSGKSSFGARNFKPTEVLSSDMLRAWVSDDPNDQGATNDAFEALYYIAGKRLKRGLLTVIDATNVQAGAQRKIVELARQYHVLPVAIVLDLPEAVCLERNEARPDRNFGPHVIANQRMQLRRSLRGLKKLGFRQIYTLSSQEEVDQVQIERMRLWNDRRDLHGPFDIIGDIHGCFSELRALLEKLGYHVHRDAAGEITVDPPEGRMPIFLGDLVDRGPDTPAVLRLVMGMVSAGTALCVPGNHDLKLVRYLGGRNVRMSHGIDATIAQLAQESPEFAEEARRFLDGLVSHYVLDDGNLVVAHAGMKEELQGRASGKVRDFAMFGETTGETDEFGLPIRHDWAREYRGQATVVYGHTPVPEPEWLNRTINIDTGCVFGGKLTALRYPEKELVSVPAREQYADPIRPLAQSPLATDRLLLRMEDVIGKQIIHTRLRGNVTVNEGSSAGALEIMSRFAVDPKWLIYLPPTMSPCETSKLPDYLEHPHEAFRYFAKRGVDTVMCQEKHMGSRAVIVLCRDEETARTRFGETGGRTGICYTRTGRPFFTDTTMEAGLLERVRAAVDAAGLWETLNTAWLCLDCELMPWSAKAQELLVRQYGPVAIAAAAGLGAAKAVADAAAARGVALEGLPQRLEARLEAAEKLDPAWRRYCWPINSLDDFRLAPFHLLASEGAVHFDKPHTWHMEHLKRLCQHDPLLHATATRIVDLNVADEVHEATAWWETHTVQGGEGMVVKPMDFTVTRKDGVIQPGVKCRGREYLRIIYGPEYTLPDQLERLHARGLSHKRSLALREFALGVEALERFVAAEPLYRVHQCVFGVLALETEPVDPRL